MDEKHTARTFRKPKFGASLRRVLALGTPLLFSQITHYFHQIADSAMLGHYGEGSAELAAVGIAGLFTWALMTFLWPFSSGVQALASRRFGRMRLSAEPAEAESPDAMPAAQASARDAEETGRVLDNGLAACTYAVGIAFAASFAARPILDALLVSDEILELALSYIGIMRIALVPTGFFVVLQGFLGAVNQTRPIMYAGLISNLLNIGLNWVFIFGNLGFPAMGIEGAALGTLIATAVSALYLFAVVTVRGWKREYRLFSFRGLSGRIQRDIVKVAVPPGVQNGIALSVFLVYQTLVESYSPLYLAATHAAFSFFRLNKTIIGAYARSAGILAGNSLGRGDTGGARSAIDASGLAGAVVAVAVAAATLCFRRQIAGLFTNDEATRAVLVQALTFFTGFFFVEALGYAFEMVFVANGYGRMVLASESATNFLFIIGATLLVRRFFPGEVHLAWLSFGLYQVAHAGVMIALWARGRWVHVRLEGGS